MSEQEIKKMRELDEAAERSGGYVAQMFSQKTHYDYRKLSEYCKERKVEPLDLTIRELRQFIVSP